MIIYSSKNELFYTLSHLTSIHDTSILSRIWLNPHEHTPIKRSFSRAFSVKLSSPGEVLFNAEGNFNDFWKLKGFMKFFIFKFFQGFIKFSTRLYHTCICKKGRRLKTCGFIRLKLFQTRNGRDMIMMKKVYIILDVRIYSARLTAKQIDEVYFMRNVLCNESLRTWKK